MIWLKSGNVFAYEALLRGDNGVDGVDFINGAPIHLRNELDQQARDRAIEVGCQLGLFNDGAKLAVNCLPNVFGHSRLCIEPTLATADACGLSHKQLIFEVTEHEDIAEKGLLAKKMQAYAHSLFASSIDDFGAGYAGISLLLQFQPNILKLDSKLVRGLTSDRVKTAIVKGLLCICRELDILSAAEGIETLEEFNRLAELGVDLAQGFHVGRPIHEGCITSATWSRVQS
jgi:EAL domain-containing protein (putative c-di-GMP-specific phosphodiesterase class I)